MLNSGLLECGKCGSQMEGTCGTGQKGVKYYYCICKNPDCRFKVPAGEIEGLVSERIGQLAGDNETMAGIVAATNERLKIEIPRLRNEKELLERELERVKAAAGGLIDEWASLATPDSSASLKEKLDELGKRRGQIEASLASLELTTADIEREAIDQDIVMKALADFSKVFAEIQPYKQKDLIRLVLHKAILGPDYVKMALYGRPPEIEALATASPRIETLNWLLGQVSRGAVGSGLLFISIPRRDRAHQDSGCSRKHSFCRRV
jgi:Recombinase zinc beta ribbon domain